MFIHKVFFKRAVKIPPLLHLYTINPVNIRLVITVRGIYREINNFSPHKSITAKLLLANKGERKEVISMLKWNAELMIHTD